GIRDFHVTGVQTCALPIYRVYGVREASLVETCQRLTYNSDGPYQATGTPSSLEHKFITEDVPTGLIPMSALGAAAGVPAPAIDRSEERRGGEGGGAGRARR